MVNAPGTLILCYTCPLCGSAERVTHGVVFMGALYQCGECGTVVVFSVTSPERDALNNEAPQVCEEHGVDFCVPCEASAGMTMERLAQQTFLEAVRNSDHCDGGRCGECEGCACQCHTLVGSGGFTPRMSQHSNRTRHMTNDAEVTHYHWRDDCYFIRHANGDVSIRQHLPGGDKYYDFGTIPANEWASIVHAMAAPGADFNALRGALGSAEPHADTEE